VTYKKQRGKLPFLSQLSQQLQHLQAVVGGVASSQQQVLQSRLLKQPSRRSNTMKKQSDGLSKSKATLAYYKDSVRLLSQSQFPPANKKRW
jgi:hypothetical protein